MFIKNKKTYTFTIMIVLTIIFFIVYHQESSKAPSLTSVKDKKQVKNSYAVDQNSPTNEKTENKQKQKMIARVSSRPVAVKNKILNRVKKIYKRSLGEDVEIELLPINYKRIEIKHKKYSAIEMIVKITRHNGVRSSFHAYIDSEDGDILSTWNQVRNDGLFYKKQKHPLFTPTGTLKR